MEITTDNFSDQKQKMIDSIKNSSFICFDCEFSGLGKGGAGISAFETPELLYNKWKSNVGEFMLMEFGLCLFRYDPNENSFLYEAYSCYIFPRLPKGLMGVRSMLGHQLTYSIQADCMEFLSGSGFQFDKWIGKGVGYLRPREVSRMQDELKKKHEWRKANNQSSISTQAPVIPDVIKPKMNQLMKKVKKFMEAEDEDSLRIPGLTAYERKFAYASFEHQFGYRLFIESVADDLDKNDGVLVLDKCKDEEEHDQKRKEKMDQELAKVEDALGFSEIITEITKSGKPVIGHNMNLDLLHSLKAFYQDLPSTWKEGRELLRSIFPDVVDTKILAAQSPLKEVVGLNSSLKELSRRVDSHPFPKVSLTPTSKEYGFSQVLDEKGDWKIDLDNLHDAGFDAFATGKLFIALSSYWGDRKNPGRNTVDIPWDLIRPHANKLHTGKVQDIPFLSVKGEQELPNRDHVLFITCEETWVNKNIQDLFSAYGAVQIYWVPRPRNSAFVVLRKKENGETALKALKVQEGEKKVKWKINSCSEFLSGQEKELHLNYQKGNYGLMCNGSLLGKREVNTDLDINSTAERVKLTKVTSEESGT